MKTKEPDKATLLKSVNQAIMLSCSDTNVLLKRLESDKDAQRISGYIQTHASYHAYLLQMRDEIERMPA